MYAVHCIGHSQVPKAHPLDTVENAPKKGDEGNPGMGFGVIGFDL